MKSPELLLRCFLIAIITALALSLANINQQAQTQTQLPAPTGFVNDFANVLDSSTRQRLETLLQNFKTRSRIDFYIATVQDTGAQDIFDFSWQLASQWKLGARSSTSKSLLLVLSVGSKSSFTQFSRMVQQDLPEGILGELAQRMRAMLAAGQFSEALDSGVQHFVTSMSRKLGFSAEDLSKPISAEVASAESPSPVSLPLETPVASADSVQTRPRYVNQPPAPDPTPVLVKANVESTETEAQPKINDAGPPKGRRKSNTRAPAATSINKNVAPPPPQVSDEDESEEVELTLTLPLDKRAVKLKEFLETHPKSKARPRAIELLINTYVALADQKLKSADPGGIDLFLLAIAEADATVTDQLFNELISPIPMNLYLRKEQAAAFKAAQEIEHKFSDNPKRLLSVAAFYLGIERGDEAARVADRVLLISPGLAEAHSVRALGLHLSLQLEEAAKAYMRVLELDPGSAGARASLADLMRGAGKHEEALVLYSEQLKANPKNKTAINGTILALLEMGRHDEANNMLEATLADDPRNLALLTGVAYWLAAHGEHEKAYEKARKAIDIESRYTWAQIALAHSFLGLQRPLDAERSIRFARQFGKFPTLTYELANVLTSMGLYDEAIEVLRESFVIEGSQIHTRLAGRFPAHNENFIDLLAPERLASLYQTTAAASPRNAKVMKDLLIFSNNLAVSENQKIDEAAATASALEFASGTDEMRTFRKLYAASRLLRSGVAFQTVFDLAQEAKQATEVALNVPAVTMAVQADEFRELRASAIGAGRVPDVAQAPLTILGDILRGRSDDLMGWALFNQAKYEPALEHLKRAVSVLPNGTPAWRTATWHLAVVLEQSGDDAGALENYIASYKAGLPDPVRRTTIEHLYKRIHGSLEGLDVRIGAAMIADGNSSQAQQVATANPEAVTSSSETSRGAPAMPAKTPTPEPSPEPPTNEPVTTKTTENLPTTNTPTPAPESVPGPTPEPVVQTPSPTPGESPAPSPSSDPGLSDESLRAAAARLRTTIKVSGRVADSENNGVANVVIVLISPSGSVLAATTDQDGKYSFTVPPSQKRYRLIPSKDGLSFTPIDRVFAGLFEDMKENDFVATPARP